MNDNPASGSVSRQKKRYEAPSVQKVVLRAEEAILGFCKNGNSAGPSGGNCRAVGVCNTQGS